MWLVSEEDGIEERLMNETNVQLQVDVDKGDVIANDLSVEAVPTVVLFKNGRRIEFLETPSARRLQLMKDDHFYHLT